MIPDFSIAAFVGAIAIRDLWSRRRGPHSIRAREERARAAHREAMRVMQDALEATNAARRTREEFLARMSHELRTPLNAVIGFSRVLESNKPGNLRPEDVDMARRVRLGGEQLLHMVDDVLQHAGRAGDAPAADARLADLVAIANAVVDDYRGSAALKGLSLTSTIPVSAPTMPLDAGRLAQVLEYLVDNAVKFTAEGGVHVTLATDAATGAPSRIIVTDTGVGIPTDRFDEIFQPFQQLETGAARRFSGAGLGLPLARQLCDSMGCRLTVESEAGKGSRFVVRLPRVLLRAG